MTMVHACSLCKKSSSSRLWSTEYIPKECRVALCLMGVGEICPACWETCVSRMDYESMVELSVSLMDDLVSREDDYKELEEESNNRIEGLEEEVTELRDALSEIQSTLKGAL